jgi:hypothetical protein
MRIAVAIIVLSIVLSGCVGVNGEPIVIADGHEVYDEGFVDGCMTSILALTTPQNLPPYEEALMKCKQIHELAGEGVFGEMPSERTSAPVAPEQETEIICDGNCI